MTKYKNIYKNRTRFFTVISILLVKTFNKKAMKSISYSFVNKQSLREPSCACKSRVTVISLRDSMQEVKRHDSCAACIPQMLLATLFRPRMHYMQGNKHKNPGAYKKRLVSVCTGVTNRTAFTCLLNRCGSYFHVFCI